MAILDDVKTYLGTVGVSTGVGTKYTDAVLNQVIAVEQAAQDHKCGAWASHTAAAVTVLTEALCRRVQANLARRALPLGVIEQSGDAEGRAFLPSVDPEIRRLEAPYRKIRVG